MSESEKFDFTLTMQELDAGIFASKLSEAIKESALGVVTHGKQGKVTLTFTMKRIGGSSQIMLSHKMAYTKPTLRGSKGEESETETPLYVSGNGATTIMPDTQIGFEFNKED
ncbi:MAG TPA: hypothetical protein ENK38_01970 [Gammaproteobacteria bacterium]|nr:hypothetical protein [Gammaproteobacteria bacterium]